MPRNALCFGVSVEPSDDFEAQTGAVVVLVLLCQTNRGLETALANEKCSGSISFQAPK